MRIVKDCSRVLCKLDSTYFKYHTDNGCLVVKLKKALYGCIQNALLSSFLVSKNFVVNPYDECVFNKDYAGVGQCTFFFILTIYL